MKDSWIDIAIFAICIFLVLATTWQNSSMKQQLKYEISKIEKKEFQYRKTIDCLNVIIEELEKRK